MIDSIWYRRLLTVSIAFLAAGVLGSCTTPESSSPPPAAEVSKTMTTNQEYYELRLYRIPGADKQKIVSDYLEKALVPALNRMGIDRVGVFTLKETPDDFSIFVLVPYATLEAFSQLNPKLASDSRYQEAAANLFTLPKDDPAYTRIESRLMKAFAGMPVLSTPDKAAETRLLELRIYESHNEDAALRKVEMFNKGEAELMQKVKLGPVFFGETLISNDVPNLTYMLSADDMESHKQHFKDFLEHPDWEQMKKIERYKDTVSNITSQFLLPTSYSQI